MPYVSLAQERYFNIHRKELEAKGVSVDEWNKASRGRKLPEHVKDKKMKKKIKKVSQPGDMIKKYQALKNKKKVAIKGLV